MAAHDKNATDASAEMTRKRFLKGGGVFVVGVGLGGAGAVEKAAEAAVDQQR
jgi:hypothetical protein